MTLEPKRLKLRNPHSLGVVRGPGLFPACANLPELEEFSVIEIMFQLVDGESATIGYADMNPETLENALCALSTIGEAFAVRLETGMRELILGDFGVALASEKEAVLITIKY